MKDVKLYAALATMELSRQFGIAIFVLVIPLICTNILHVGTFAVGVSMALMSVGYLFMGFIAGKVADSFNRQLLICIFFALKSLLVGILVGVIVVRSLSTVWLYILTLIIGLAQVFADTALTAWIPDLVQGTKLIRTNGVLQTVRSLSELIGPAIGGVLVEFFEVKGALLIVAVLLFVGSMAVWFVQRNNVDKKLYRNSQPDVMNEMNRDGDEIRKSKVLGKKKKFMALKVIVRQPVLRAITGTVAMINLSIWIYQAVAVVFLTEVIREPVGIVGSLVAMEGIGGVIGSIISTPLIMRLGMVRTVKWAPIIPNAGLLLAALAGHGWGVIWFVVGITLSFAARSIGSVARTTIQQSVLPKEISGTIQGTMMMLTWGMIPLGSFIGGILGNLIGPRMSLVVAGCILIFSNAWMLGKGINQLVQKRLDTIQEEIKRMIHDVRVEDMIQQLTQ